ATTECSTRASSACVRPASRTGRRRSTAGRVRRPRRSTSRRRGQPPRRSRAPERLFGRRTASTHGAGSGPPLTAAAGSGLCASTSERRCLAPEHVPREPNVLLGRPEVPHGEPQLVPVREARVGEEHLARVVDALEQALVFLVRSRPSEAHEREVPRSGDLPPRLVTHPALEELREPHVLAETLLQAPAAVAAHRPPQLP